MSGPQFIYHMHRLSKIVPPKREILKNINLSFYPGAKIGVVGPNGAGKSSLIKIMAGLDQPSNGDATLSAGYTVGTRANCGSGQYCRDACPACDADVRQCTRVGACVVDGDCPAGITGTVLCPDNTIAPLWKSIRLAVTRAMWGACHASGVKPSGCTA